eukprot:CAMPEP_0118702276 /NCGR_PEP_ID=MMETSP0800-20121206/17790_1 /TAXON_ID=210618 ORGANISM="Striatella unipunctata, Strain CCMP2910" /NCGR_SAMPLE_ID=MMETSP0800 /ASSEMBLY_ACC=CAM_ASM_000638 /LENGTH=208 /DNA_ID=CAMNT_0006603437 /DNA_START=178 /DNA_END=804 /DNA_ORIENTATION=+
MQTLATDPIGLWTSINYWQTFATHRISMKQNEMQREFQDKLLAYLKESKGYNDNNLPSSISTNDLPKELRTEVDELQERTKKEIQPLVRESTLVYQKFLEAMTHHDRCKLLNYFVSAERKRLEAKKTLTAMFGSGVASSAIMPSMMSGTGSSSSSTTTTTSSNLIQPPEEEEVVLKAPSSSASATSQPQEEEEEERDLTFLDEMDAFQ